MKLAAVIFVIATIAIVALLRLLSDREGIGLAPYEPAEDEAGGW